MKRLHIHLSVENLTKNIEFYSALFGCRPSVQHEDYAKWLLDDPRVNFAISSRSSRLGLDHLGIQTENELELDEIKQQLEAAQMLLEAQQDAACCYARSNKYWVSDPQGIAWEAFHTLDSIPTFTDKRVGSDGENPYACKPVGDNRGSCCG